MRWCDPGMGGIQLNDQKDNVDGANGVAAHSISPRPLARAREIWVPTVSDKVAVSAPALMARLCQTPTQ